MLLRRHVIYIIFRVEIEGVVETETPFIADFRLPFHSSCILLTFT